MGQLRLGEISIRLKVSVQQSKDLSLNSRLPPLVDENMLDISTMMTSESIYEPTTPAQCRRLVLTTPRWGLTNQLTGHAAGGGPEGMIGLE